MAAMAMTAIVAIEPTSEENKDLEVDCQIHPKRHVILELSTQLVSTR